MSEVVGESTTTVSNAPIDPVVKDGDATFCVSTLNSHLCCNICNGYLRHAATITECLHTFCRSCLYKHFRAYKPACPTCMTPINLTNSTTILADRTIQDLVKKIFPEAVEKDDEEEATFYASRGIKRKPDVRSAPAPASAPAKKPKAAPEPQKDELNFQLMPCPDSDLPHPSLGLPKLIKPFLRTSGRLKILQVKKYIQKKLELQGDGGARDIAVFCKGGVMGDELNLTFIHRTRWDYVGGSTEAPKDLVLHFRLKAANE